MQDYPKEIGLPENLARALTINYLLYPLIFNVNLFDFHPDVIAVPVILFGILAIYKRNFLIFLVSLFIILSCKAVFSLTVAAIGIWLILFKKKRSYGIVALILGITWFILSTQLIIPSFRGEEHSAISRYAYLGDSTFEIARNIFLKPILVFQHIFTIANLEYLLLLLSPLIWGLSFRHLSPLIAASPTLFLNLITNYSLQKDLLHQYSLPILPFLFLAVIEALVAKRGFLKQPQWIIVWGIIAFVSLAKVGFLWTQYLASIDNWKMKREVLTLVETKGSVLTISELAPHLSQRPVIQLIGNETENITLSDFEYILFDLRYPSWGTSKTALEKLKAQVSEKSQFQLCYERAGVNLWERITNN